MTTWNKIVDCHVWPTKNNTSLRNTPKWLALTLHSAFYDSFNLVYINSDVDFCIDSEAGSPSHQHSSMNTQQSGLEKA